MNTLLRLRTLRRFHRSPFLRRRVKHRETLAATFQYSAIRAEENGGGVLLETRILASLVLCGGAFAHIGTFHRSNLASRRAYD